MAWFRVSLGALLLMMGAALVCAQAPIAAGPDTTPTPTPSPIPTPSNAVMILLGVALLRPFVRA